MGETRFYFHTGNGIDGLKAWTQKKLKQQYIGSKKINNAKNQQSLFPYGQKNNL